MSPEARWSSPAVKTHFLATSSNKCHLLTTSVVVCTGMEKGLTEGDLQRIAKFADTVPYDRRPEMLLPEETDEEN